MDGISLIGEVLVTCFELMAYRDIELESRTNKDFQSLLLSHANEMALYEPGSKTSDRKKFQEVVAKFLADCDYNLGFLVPYFFPRYPKDKPMSLVDRPFAFHMYDIQVGGSLVINGSRQISKSTNCGARNLMMAHMFPGFRSIYIAPHHDNLKTYADKLRELERAFRFQRKDKNFRQNLYYKEYSNGAMIKLIYALTSAAAARGNTTDEILFDEYQNFDRSIEPEIEEIQKSSQIPITIYAGTALTTDTALAYRWSESSKGTWHLRCGCGEWINTGDAAVALAVIKPEGVCCPKCSRLQNVRTGQYVHEDMLMYHGGKKGIHVPQIIIPDFVEDEQRWAKIYNQFRTTDPKKFLQEILGIATEEGAREITQQHLRDICVLDLAEVKIKLKTGRYRLVVSGVDWGGSDYNQATKTKSSYTVHVMLGKGHDGGIDIIYMKRYAGMNYREIVNDIMKNHIEMGGMAFASDHGGGQIYNLMIREELGDPSKHLVFGYVGPKSLPISEPAGDHMFNQFSINRTESISSLYEAIKMVKIRCYQWGLSQQYLDDFLNLYRVISENAAGASSFVYRRHGSKADDTLHAVNFAYVLMRLMDGEPLVQDKSLMDKIQNTLRGASFNASRLGRKIGVVSG